MKVPRASASILLLVGHVSAASKLRACPLLGQQYPPPARLSDDPSFQAATQQIEDALAANAKTYNLAETSFSLGMFSTSEDGLLYDHHHTTALLSNSSQGTRKIDNDSIYRIGSISKLLTMYMFQIAAEGDKYFNDPISKHVPALQQAKSTWNPITPEWDDITVGDLAGQMAGLARDFGLADFAPPQGQIGALPPAAQAALPKIPADEIPSCGYLRPDGTFPACKLQDYIDGIASESPIFPTAYTPVYSNEAFALIGLALQQIAGREPEAIFDSEIVKALGLTGTTYTVPESIPSTAIIPSNPKLAGWDSDLGVFGPAGGYFSSTNDLATMGKAMLSSTLLPIAQTRRWMKPSSFVEDFAQGVGRPWEIFRVKVNGQSVDAYSKSGDWGVYSTAFILVPQYDFGVTLLTARDPAGAAPTKDLRTDFPNEIFAVILPVLDRIAKEQALSNFAGSYIDPKTNSSVVVGTDSQNSGLLITSWFSKGVDLLGLLALTTKNIVLRLQPNQIPYGDGKIGFTSYYSSATPPLNRSEGFFQCAGWFDVDEFTYGNIPLGQVVFGVDSTGIASSVELRAFRATLTKR